MKYLFFVLLILFGLSALARTQMFSKELPSSVGFSVNSDSADSSGADMNGLFYLKNNVNFQLATGSSKNKTNDDEGTFKYNSIGVGSDPLKMVSASIVAEGTTLDDYIKSTGITAPIFVNYRDFEFGLTPGVRSHIIVTDDTTDDDVGFQENSFYASLAYYGFDPVSIRVFSARHSYSEEVENFSNTVSEFPQLLSLLKGSTLSLLTSLVSTRRGLEFGYGYKKFYFSLLGSRTVSAFDDVETTAVELGTDYKLNNKWLLSLNLGSAGLPDSDDPDTERVRYVSLGATYSWFWHN